MSSSSTELDRLNDTIGDLEARLPRSGSRDEALEIAIRAAETSMKALKLANDPQGKSELSSRAKRLVEVAERIKRSDGNAWQAATLAVRSQQAPSARDGKSRALIEPQSTRPLSKAEQITVLKSGFLNGLKFPPWSGPPSPSEFKWRDGEGLFLDPAELSLSSFQRRVFDGWKRPAEALPQQIWVPHDRQDLIPSMSPSREIDLVQDVATDCSVVASLCATVARDTKTSTGILRNRIFPYDLQDDKPLLSENGKYIVKLNFNGCDRKVFIDDRLPTTRTNRTIHVIDRHNPGLLWPALIEKAYLKVRGGYDFPGSNSGTDLAIITGWIPEQVFLQSDDLEPDSLWRRTSRAFECGDVLITMGTGKMSTSLERELNLAGEHDYAVIDVREVSGQRLFLIKNPWCEGTSWAGSRRQDHSTDDNENNPSHDSFSLTDLDDEPVASSRDLLNADEHLRPGTFWMDLDNVVQNFESIYLNWNPGLFAYRQDVHFDWDLSSCKGRPRGRFASLGHHPQYIVTAAKGGVVWVVLCRHFQNMKNEEQRREIDLNGYISIFAFASGGKRALLADRTLQKGPFVDSPHTLMKLEDCRPGVPYTLTPAEQDLLAKNHAFTITAFSHSPITLGEAENRYQYANTLSAAWTPNTAGGNAHSPDYSINPQFALTVSEPTQVCILLEAANDELNVHVKLVRGKGQRVHTIRSRDIIFDSKDYRRGCCTAEFADLGAGRYTIICSTFEPQQLGDFSLRVETNKQAQFLQLPREGAGRIRREMSNAVFSPGACKVAALILPARTAKVYCIARLLVNDRSAQRTPASRSLVRMSIVRDRGLDKEVLVASADGEFRDGFGGIRTDDIELSPNMRRLGDLWLVIDRMYPATEEESFSVELFLDQLDAINAADWKSWDD